MSGGDVYKRQANDRMLSAILEKNRSVHDRKDKVNYMSRKKSFKRFLIPVAACLVVIVAVTGIIGGKDVYKRQLYHSVGMMSIVCF